MESVGLLIILFCLGYLLYRKKNKDPESKKEAERKEIDKLTDSDLLNRLHDSLSQSQNVTSPANKNSSQNRVSQPIPDKTDNANADHETKLEKMKQAYENRKRTVSEKNDAGVDPDFYKLLNQTVRKILPFGEILSSWNGQRQLFLWMVEGIPCLRKLTEIPQGEVFKTNEISDDPMEYQPVVNAMLEKAAEILKECNWVKEEKRMLGLHPEQLCSGWHSLRYYADHGTRKDIFTDAEQRIERIMANRRDIAIWLRYQLSDTGEDQI